MGAPQRQRDPAHAISKERSAVRRGYETSLTRGFVTAAAKRRQPFLVRFCMPPIADSPDLRATRPGCFSPRPQRRVPIGVRESSRSRAGVLLTSRILLGFKPPHTPHWVAFVCRARRRLLRPFGDPLRSDSNHARQISYRLPGLTPLRRPAEKVGFPTCERTADHPMPYNVWVTVFGVTDLHRQLADVRRRNRLAPAFYVIGAAVMSLIAGLLIVGQSGQPLDQRCARA